MPNPVLYNSGDLLTPALCVGMKGSGARTTTWNYSFTRGWLTGKRDANNSGPDYGYSPRGRLKTRQSARTGGGRRRGTGKTGCFGMDFGFTQRREGLGR